MAERTWEARELPILEAIAASEEQGQLGGSGMLAEATGLPPEIVDRTVESLERAGYITGIEISDASQRRAQFIELRLNERGRRTSRQWPPDNPFDNLASLLEARIGQVEDTETRSKLESFREALADIGKGTATGILTAFVRSAAGLQ